MTRVTKWDNLARWIRGSSSVKVNEDGDGGVTLSSTGGGGGSGTVTSVGITAPAAGIQVVSGSPVTTSGNIQLGLANDLAALEALSGTNTIPYRSGTDTWAGVTIGTGLSFSSGTLSNSFAPNIPVIKRTGVRHVAGDASGINLVNTVPVASRIYYVPFYVTEQVTLDEIGYRLITNPTGTVSLGVYDTTTLAGQVIPNSLLASASGLSVAAPAGYKSSAVSLSLSPHVLYWAASIFTSAANLNVQGVPVAASQTYIGRDTGSVSCITHLYETGSGSTLPTTAGTLVSGTGTVPAVYLNYA